VAERGAGSVSVAGAVVGGGAVPERGTWSFEAVAYVPSNVKKLSTRLSRRFSQDVEPDEKLLKDVS
jgi:hypothetical protein